MKKALYLLVILILNILLAFTAHADKSETHAHTYISSITTEPTCWRDGVITYTCECGDSYTDVIEKNDHDYNEWWVKTKPTCTKAGVEWTYCRNCDNDFEREIPATGHTVIEYVMRATTDEQAAYGGDGAYITACDVCNEVFKQDFFARPAEYKLSSSNVTYNGKVRKPSVTVKDADGKKLVEGTDYDVIYPDGMKLPGKYDIEIFFKGNYLGGKHLTFTIAPKATTGVKAKILTANSITLVWSKTTGATGYRVYQYSSSKGEYVLKKSLTGTSYKVTGLKEGTSYKFKIRPYTKENDGTVIWGDYSSTLSVKTKSAYSIKMLSSAATLYIGASKTLKATPTPSSKTVAWKSSDKSIAKVSSDGKVTAVKKGTVTITAYFKVDGKTYKDTCTITVKTPSVKLSETSATLVKGKTLKLKATTAPSDLAVTWKSSNTSVATVSSSGTVTAKKAGSATITASITYKGVTYKKNCKITVLNATPKENVKKLMNYVNKNGKYDSDGWKYIKKTLVDDAYTYVYKISCSPEMDGIHFTLNTDCPYGEGIVSEIHMYLDKDVTEASFQGILISYNKYGEALYTAWAMKDMKPSSYVNENEIFDEWFYNRFPNKNSVTELRDSLFGTAMSMWNVMVYDAIGVGLTGLGLTNYKG